MKRAVQVVVFMAVMLGLSLFSVGCLPDGGDDGVSPEDDNVLWERIAEAQYYDVYRADTRFGDYELIASEIIDEGIYDADYSEYKYYKIVAVGAAGEICEQTVSREIDLFGENTCIISPEDNPVEVQEFIEEVYSQQEDAHFGERRVAIYLKPGIYADGIDISVGYYTTVCGLGKKSDDVSIMRMRCTDTWNTNALINFWRGAENLTLRNDLIWAVSQGAFLRGVDVKGNASLWHTGSSSGGFMADCNISGIVTSGSQQQWLSRNSKWKYWDGALWNMVFLGNEDGCAPQHGWSEGQWNTVVDRTPIIREKPYLIFENGEYSVFVPSLKTDVSGLYNAVKDDDARIIPLSDFYVAKEGDTSAEMNAALSQGKNLFFTPGIYRLEEPLKIVRDNTIVMGTGLATLVPDNDEGCMLAGDVEGLTISGLLFDAFDSDYLLKVGSDTAADENRNTLIADCFFRVGGASDLATRADTCLIVNADGVIMDNIWTWRADHGYRWRESQNTLAGVGWDVNKGRTGVIVNGEGVTAYGLFSEHFQGHNVIWNGDDGNVIFYQSEIAYDIPTEEGKGNSSEFVSFYIGDGTMNFKGKAMGIYTHFWNGGISIDSAVRTSGAENVFIENIVAIALSGNNDSHLTNVIDDEGGVVGAERTQVRILSY